MQRDRFRRPQSFDSMNEINNLSFDDLISLPISPQNLQTDQYFCSDSSSRIKKGGPLKKRKATVDSNQEVEKEKKMKVDDSPEKLKKDGAVAEAEAPPPLKRDFIHVRARRGQATDSHSLAERVSFFSVLRGRNPSITVRRERISERMKYLEGLVPGCNKITGKAGMLDEIINYVQSLQRQVEFLSMKLATVNPWIDSNIDIVFPKEVNLGCNPSMTTVNVSPELVEPNYTQNNPMSQMSANCGLNIDMNFSDLLIRSSLGSPLTVHDTFLDPSFNVNNSTWEANSQSIGDLEFIQLPIQSLSGCYSPYNLKL